jgi:F-type H+-transporting ATPase subunit epsilon
MSEAVTLRVLTEAGTAIEEPAVSVILPGEVGSLGVLHNHAPLVTTLRPGRLIWQRQNGERLSAHVDGGLFEVARNTCTLLTSEVSEPTLVAREARV